MINIRLAIWSEDQDILKKLRETVFVEEQQVPVALEWDGKDEKALHLLGFNEKNEAVATVRYLSSGQIGRMAVLVNYRHQGYGTALLEYLLGLLSEVERAQVFLHAQTHAAEFYRLQGFVEQGGIFEDAGIEHVEMVWNKMKVKANDIK